MDSHHQEELELEIDRLLKDLPALKAPAALAPRVLSALARRKALPWYRQPWPTWPVSLRVAALLFMLGSCGALCFACYQLTRAAGFSIASQELAQTFSWLGSVWNVLSALGNAAVLTIKHFGTWFIAGCCFAGVLGYAICVGLGTACVRLAYARR